MLEFGRICCSILVGSQSCLIVYDVNCQIYIEVANSAVSGIEIGILDIVIGIIDIVLYVWKVFFIGCFIMLS